MLIDGTFEVRAPVDRVWSLLKDVPAVTPCIPDAEILERVDERTYRIRVGAVVGPVRLTYKALLTVEAIDDEARSAVLRVSGTDVSGRGGLSATARSTVSSEGQGARLALTVDAKVSGVIASLGGGLIQTVAKKKIAEFAANVEKLAQS